MRRLIVALLLTCAAAASYSDDAHHGRDRSDDNGTRHLQLFDAQGHRVGRLTSLGGSDGVLLDSDGVPIFAAIERRSDSNGTSATDFQWSAPSVLSYAAAGCSGTPLVRYDPDTYRQQAARPSMAVRNGADVTIYIAADGLSAAMKNVSASSAAHGCENLVAAPRTTCEDGCVWPPSQAYTLPFASQAWPVAGTYELTRRFPEPLRIGER
ncbi:hypothetical protein [Paraburkholderia sp. ZP32-5]|uniref:hypothetical protein n=1 Tax=Paraburkholderia sp. ZP32-5 TaxID=2883245 RepID=UPI001F37F97E|nr:hypothetical protein [Paraburkholderia sp. ZP32-5]